MLDPQLLKQDTENLAAKLRVRGYVLDVDNYRLLEDKRRTLQGETEALQARRNKISREIGAAKSRGEEIQSIMDSISDLGEQLKSMQSELSEVQSQLHSLFSEIPNIAHASVPEGSNENDNVEVR